MNSYADGAVELGVHKYHLKDVTGKRIPFLLSLCDQTVPFSILTRYLVFNSVTGMMHLFNHEQSSKEEIETGFFELPEQCMPKLVRTDIKRYMHFYIANALRTIGDATEMCSHTPRELLHSMSAFWHLTGCAQDTIVICLEVQQLYLYVHLYRELLSWYKMLPKLTLKAF